MIGNKGYDEAEKLMVAILEQKLEFEKKSIKPRLVLINRDLCDMILNKWLESYRELPWGDTTAHELQCQMEKNRNVFLGDGTLFGLWVVKVETIETFEVR